MYRANGHDQSRHMLLAARALWALLVIVHIPVLLGASRSLLEGGGVGALVSVLALCLAVTIFVLKLFDAPFLRLPSRRASAIAFVLVCAVVHREVAVAGAAAAAAANTPAAVATWVGVEGTRRSHRWLYRRWLQLTAIFGSVPNPPRPVFWASSPAGQARCSVDAFRAAVARGPPLGTA